MAKKQIKKTKQCIEKDCGKEFKSFELLWKHKVQEHLAEHVSYYSLIENVYQWGYEHKGKRKANEFRKHPYDFALQMSVLLHILNALQDIKRELQKEKKVVDL